MSGLVRLAMAAWVTAVMVVSPVLAAAECRRCCTFDKPKAAACPHCPAPADDACCSQPGQTSERPCRQCPRCEWSRPTPATASASKVVWQPSIEWAFLDRSDAVPQLTAGGRSLSLNDDGGLIPHPSRQALYCTWLK